MKSNKYRIVKYVDTSFMFVQYCSSGFARFTNKESRAKKFDCEEAIIEAQKLTKLGYEVYLEQIDVKT